MTTKKAIEVLTNANEWRRYDGEAEKHPDMPNPKQFGLAMDHAIEIMKRFEGAVEIYKDHNKDLYWCDIWHNGDWTIKRDSYTLYAIPKEQK